MARRLLLVDIVEAKNLIACERSGTSDPFLVAQLVSIGGKEIKNEKFKTSTKNRTLSPNWNQRFTFGQNYDLNNTAALPILRLEVFHKASTFGTDAPMGVVDVPLDKINPDGFAVNQWYPMQKTGRMKDVAGELHLILKFTGPPGGGTMSTGSSHESKGNSGDVAMDLGNDEENPDDEHMEPNELQILVIQAKDLAIRDKGLFSGGSSDPLAVLSIKGCKTQKTKHINKCLNPVWNENFNFNVTDPSLSLEVVVEDYDLTMNDFIGKIIIPLRTFQDKQSVRKWYKLRNEQGIVDAENRGEIELNIKWRFNVDLVEKKKSGGFFGIGGGKEEGSDVEEDDGEEAKEKEPTKEEAEAAAKEKEEAEKKLKEELGAIDVKSGDYQIQIHLIEARELKGKNLNGLSDPVVYMEVLDQKQNSTVQKESLNCVFDEVYIFNFRNLDKDVFSEGIIRIKVMDANVLTKNVLIGSYNFDATQVYFQKDHEFYRKWVALMNEDDPQDNSVQGYLKLTVQIVGPGEKMKIHDEEEEARKEREAMAKSGNDLGSMIIMPPTIKKEWKFLVTTVYRAEYLPVMDLSAISALSASGTDAFVSVSFAGGKATKTKVKTLKGDRSAMNPIFNYEIWIPVSCPTASQTCRISVWDYDLSGNELIATFYTKFNVLERLRGNSSGVYWSNLYGAPEDSAFSLKSAATGAVSSLKKIGGMDPKEVYNTFPDRASTFKGRLLISQRIETKRPAKYDKEEMEPFRRKIKRLTAKQEPPSQHYALMALIISGTELPQLIDPTNPLKKQKLTVRVSIGQHEMTTQPAECNKGVCEWSELLKTPSEGIEFPVDVNQIPDICVHLCKGKGKDQKAICFSRVKATKLLNENFTGSCDWILLNEDKSIDALDDGEFPGTILIKLGFGTLDYLSHTPKLVAEWNTLVETAKRRQPYQVRAHIYQGADLPATDSNGLLDPYLKINCLGEVKKSSEVSKSRFPLYYETIVFDCQLPTEREFLPQVNIKVWDKDALKDEYVNQIFYDLKNAFILHDLKDPLPDPEWMECFQEVPGDSQGRLLVSFQLIKKSSPDQKFDPPPSIKPALKDAWIEIIALGLRDMKPFKFQEMVSPFLEMELECVDKKVKIETENSKRPHPSSPNFLQRLVMEVKLPENALFATPMTLRARDTRLGGFSKPEVGVGSVDLVNKIPWSKTYKPPQTDIFFKDSMNMAAGFTTATGEQKSNEPVLDATAKKAIEMAEKRRVEKEEDELVLTQEPLSVEEDIKRRINDMDTGAGVFGALLHIDTPLYGGGKHKKTAEDFFTEVDLNEIDDDEPPKYMKGRHVLPSELEDDLKTTPFETYDLTRGKQNGMFGSTLKVVGRFKGLVRVMLAANEAPLFDMDKLLKPQAYVYRLYVLRGLKLAPMDVDFKGRPSASDPYLRVLLGKDVFDDRVNAVDDVVDVDFYKMIEMKGELPGFSQLVIEVMDKDTIGSDDMIGKTVIDLEDRWFDSRWQDLGKANRVLPDDDPNSARWDTKPLERRAIYVPSSNGPQGTIECWLDILTPGEAGAFPPDDVALPPKQMFELRIVVWKTKDVPAQDTLGGQNMTDLFIKVWPEGCDEQETDTHWRSKKGKASFNWRMLFDVELGHNTRSMKFPYLHIQFWDRDLLKWNDCFADGLLDLTKYYRKAYKRNIAIKAFETKKGGAAKRAAVEKKKREEAMQGPIPDTDADKVPPEATPENNMSDADGSNEHKNVDSDDEEEDTGIGVMGKVKSQDKQKLVVNEKGKSDAAGKDEPKQGFFDWILFKKKVPEEDKKKVAEESKSDDKPSEAKAEDSTKEANDNGDEELDQLITTIKNMTGLWDLDPEDSDWLPMTHLNHETGVREPMGKVCLGMQIWPKDKAKVMPVGAARTEPNQDPFLPPPVGRLKFSWNPFVLGMELCGPSLCFKFMCCILCLGILALMIFCQPALNILIALFLY